MMKMERAYICIDLKSYYASVECASRGLDPLKTNLLVADESRTDQTICLAVSPALKAIGVPSRPRLFEAKQAIRLYETAHHCKVDYLIATPRMAEYERISAQIYGIYLRYVSAEDIHVYSIDECFIDCTKYLHFYEHKAEEEGVHPAHLMAMTMIRDVLGTTGITATVGIGTNLYLAKIAMDIVAKKKPADEDGVRIAELNEDSYKFLLWDHQPLTDFWQIGRGKARRLMQAGMRTMGDIAQRSQWDEEFFYRTFGIDGEILIDHAWGIEPVTMENIKAYKPSGNSLSNGQVLPRPYRYEEAVLVFQEMIEVLCADMFAQKLISRTFTWWLSYDSTSLEKCPGYQGPLALDFYGRVHPLHAGGTGRFLSPTSNAQAVTELLIKQFDERTDHRLLYRRLGVCASEVVPDESLCQMDIFENVKNEERDRRIQKAMLEMRRRYGANAIFKGINMLEGATTLERNQQIGGHKA